LGVLGPDTINEALDEFDTEPGSVLEVESRLLISQGWVRAALDRAFACHDVESIIAELETFATPEFVRVEDQSEVQTWARRTLDALALRSPTSLKIALEAIRMAEREDYRLSDVLQRDLAMNLNTAFAVRTPPLSFFYSLNYSLECFSVILKVRGYSRFPYWGDERARERGPCQQTT
jgi:Enoyl-CoA hydratase/isomerase